MYCLCSTFSTSYLVFQLTTMCPFFFNQPCILGGTYKRRVFSSARFRCWNKKEEKYKMSYACTTLAYKRAIHIIFGIIISYLTRAT